MLALISLSHVTNAQSPNWLWAKRMGGTSSDVGQSIAADPTGSGDVYTTGYFTGTVDFDPGAGVFNLTAAGLWDIFISKLDGSGNFVWAKAMGGPGNHEGVSVAIDPASGAIYTTGFFSATVDFDPGVGVFNLTSAGSGDIFISKLDTSGNFVWAKQMGGTAYDKCYSIAIDTAGSGDVYTTGVFEGTADFDPGAGTFNLTPAGSSDIFISKLDSSGNFVWAKSLGGNLSEGADVIEFNYDNKPYIGGYFSSTPAYFGSIALSNTANSPGDMFILRLGTINTGFENDFKENSIFISPNPFTDNVTIQSQKYLNNESFTILDNAGRIIRRGKLNHETSEINLKGLAKGIYFLQTGKYNENTFKLVKQ